MSVVLVVTRNPSITLALAGAGFEIIEVRPQALDAWLQVDARPDPDAVVVAQAGPQEALATLYAIRDHGVAAPALLLASSEAAWAALDEVAPGGSTATRVLVLPVGGPALIAAVTDVIALPDAYVGAHVAPSEPGPDEPEAAADDGADHDGETPPDATPAPVDEPPPEVADDERLAEVRETVRRLLRGVDDVYGVPESAAVIVADARTRVGADAAAILVADGDRWRPAAAEGAGEDELGEVLGPSSWLASTIGPARRGLVIEVSDLARERLQGVPLAGRRHLVVAPVPPAHAVLVLARDDDPGFGEEAVAILVSLAAEAGPVLAAALDARALARALAPLRDVEHVPDRADGSSA
jgi:hypothetical protein